VLEVVVELVVATDPDDVVAVQETAEHPVEVVETAAHTVHRGFTCLLAMLSRRP
jgi:hypothetical protein